MKSYHSSKSNVIWTNTHELRIILIPERDETTKGDTIPQIPFPFSQETFHALMESCNFHKSIFNRRLTMAASRIVMGDVTSFFVARSAGGQWCNMRVFASTNNKTHITTIFIHGALPFEIDYIERRLFEVVLHPLIIHPMLIAVIIMEIFCIQEESQVFSCIRHSVSRLFTSGQVSDTGTGEQLENKNLDVARESKAALRLQHCTISRSSFLEMTTNYARTFLSWCKEFDKSSLVGEKLEIFEEANSIVCNRLEYLLSRLESLEIQLKEAQAYNQVYRQSLEVKSANISNQLNVRIAAQSRDIARDSKRDSSAMKAIAVLTMFFLPGTFVAACFAMPLFDWDAPFPASVVNSRFWIYAVTTIPTATMVILIWRLWYKFEEWRQWNGNGTGESFYKDGFIWLKSGRTKQPKQAENDTGDYLAKP